MGTGKSRKVRNRRQDGQAELETEVDIFHKKRESQKKKDMAYFVTNELDEDDDESDSDSEEAVLDVDGEDADSDEEEEDDSEEEEEEEEEAALHTRSKGEKRFSKRLLSLMESQEASLKGGRKIQQGETYEDEDDEEELSDEEEEAEDGDDEHQWGRNKKTYYHGRDKDEYDDKKVEEEEAQRLQSKAASRFRDEDFEIDEDEDSEDSEDSEGGDPPRATHLGENGHTNNIHLSVEEQHAIIEADAPELSSLLGDLKGNINEVKTQLEPVLEDLKAKKLAASSKDGISFLESKYMLMMSYCTHIVLYLLMKAEGKSVKNHPILSRLVELRTYMEKIRPIEKKMQYQIQKLMSSLKMKPEDVDEENDKDPLAFGPKPDALVPKLSKETLEEDAVYKPPKIAPLAYEEEERRNAQQLAHKRNKALRNEYVQHLVNEMHDAPEEISLDVTKAQHSFVQREKRRMEKRSEIEEDMFTRTPLTKLEKKRLKAAKTKGFTSLSVLDELGTDIADLVDDDDDDEEKDQQRRKNISENLRFQQAASKQRSGDEDIPFGSSLHDRRVRHDRIAVKRNQDNAFDASDDNASDSMHEEDEFYQKAKARLEARKEGKKKRKLGTSRTSFPPLEDKQANGKREIGYNIQKNRGLTPNRNKDLKNPRKRNRAKYGKAVTRRKGQVQDQRERRESYGGESTGIKSRVTKSVKL